MIDRPDLLLVTQVAAQGSLAAAARQLDLEPPAVSKRLAALEAQLGVRLFHRTTRRLALTDEGELFCAQAQTLLAGLQALEDGLQARRVEPRGSVRIASSFGFGRRWVAPALSAFQQRHPQVELQLHLMEQLPDLTSGGIDCAVWLWTPRHGQAVTRKLAANRRVLVASPDYVARRGAPRLPADLAQHDCLVVREHDSRYAQWRLTPLGRKRDARPVTVRVQGPLSSNSGEVVRDWALAGHGIMLRSLWDVHEALAAGRLVQLLPGYAMLDADVHWVAPQRAQADSAPLRLRLLQDHLLQWFATPPWLTNPT
ncbi:LysR substrate-binding domain-containing protein [Caldimonas brevitalea]|uniref:LysR family transcriptional regulator n=1 Tax=Caldimonas brevitalea TaxID=413882 RepID=A0A0G3BH97_9BURK|nr:LysR substrate-binding domain-containing protein [Caldimonas brevitalea]AKJ28742.1 LysR family transcriptional regulator [Caldimonas brevitalea]